ncbi:MAG TPA: di-heme oxidoredictase family protein, partial [Myxococcaceae bacterium]|nr:di-heme oxidoredictase family protein [Myxococcaceae bacterium]
MKTRIVEALATAALLAGCGVSQATNSNDQQNQDHGQAALRLGLVANQGFLDFGGEVPTTSPAAFLYPNTSAAHGYKFNGAAGAVVTLETGSAGCQLDSVLTLFGPESAPNVRQQLARAHGSSPLPNATPDYQCTSRIDSFTLPVTGQYMAVVTASVEGVPGSTYGIRLTCISGSCNDPAKMVYADTRLPIGADGNIGTHTPFQVGGFLFEHNYAVSEGLGNGLPGLPGGPNARPNMRKVHFGGFGGPEATSCVGCHNQAGDSGSGGNLSNIFQIGDGVDPNSGLQRNPPHLFGMGYREQIGFEMTADLKGQLAAGISTAVNTAQPVTVSLTSKGISFGTAVANADGTTDLSGVQGVDPDLVVRPFGWKGRESLLRRFIEGGLRVHFGMETVASLNGHCKVANTATFGTGADCQDADQDGVYDEVTDAQLTALSIWAALLPAPADVAPQDPVAAQRTVDGEGLFNSIGCAGCHTATVTMNSNTFTERSDTAENPNLEVDLTKGVGHRIAVNTDGTTTVELYSDFKRHDMGASLADSKPFKEIAASQFITTPLWDVSDTGPYLHDGRAPTLAAAIVQHDGEGLASAQAFQALSLDDQSKVVEFLGTLQRLNH